MIPHLKLKVVFPPLTTAVSMSSLKTVSSNKSLWTVSASTRSISVIRNSDSLTPSLFNAFLFFSLCRAICCLSFSAIRLSYSVLPITPWRLSRFKRRAPACRAAICESISSISFARLSFISARMFSLIVAANPAPLPIRPFKALTNADFIFSSFTAFSLHSLYVRLLTHTQ